MIGLGKENITFGRYKNEDVKWRILTHDCNKFLLLSEKAIDGKMYHNESVDITWEKCDLRKWLNSDFINTAFSIEEQKIILKSKVSGDYNEKSNLDNQGNDTQDKLFLLSSKEFKDYFINDNDAQCEATAYAIKNGVFVNGVATIKNCEWWLRTSGLSNKDVCYAFKSGDYNYSGSNAIDIKGIRPAMWIIIEDKRLLDDMLRLAFKQEKLLSFGKYPQSGENKEDIKWRVLTRDSEKTLIISEKILDNKKFQPYGYGCENVTWKDSDLRKWLNQSFLNDAFNSDEQRRILTTTVTLTDKKKQGDDVLEVTQDKLFLLNMEEANKYFKTDKDRQCKPTEFAIKNGIYVNAESGNSSWWLNSIPSKKGKTATVLYPGYINEFGSLTTSSEGVRPALWISLKDKEALGKEFKQEINKQEDKWILFGKYKQNEENKEDIRWRVLKRDGDKALIISEKGIDFKPFNIKNIHKTWEECDLRKWLNNEFLYETFSIKERGRILSTIVTADKNPGYSVDAGNDTEDKIFLLSIDEVNKYFDHDAQCCSTKYAKKQEKYPSNTGFSDWWLRTPGWSDSKVSYVNSQGNIYDKGTFINSDGCCAVRPALWISLKSEEKLNKKVAPKLKVDTQYITLGKYKQLGNEKEDIKWRVLAHQGDYMLVISENALDCKKYHNESVDITWDKCDLRKWLNNEFLNEAFSSDEQKNIKATIQRIDATNNYNTYAGIPTEDKVFLLNINEVNEYLGNDAKCFASLYAQKQGALVNEENGCCNWFLRVPGFAQNYVSYVTTMGYNSVFGCFPNETVIAIRPAMWVKIRK